MKIMMALYQAPSDSDQFLAHYRDVHMPLVRKLPGLLDAEIVRIDRTLVGEPGNFLLAKMSFADADAFRTAMKSPENAAVGVDAEAFAPGIITIMVGESLAF